MSDPVTRLNAALEGRYAISSVSLVKVRRGRSQRDLASDTA